MTQIGEMNSRLVVNHDRKSPCPYKSMSISAKCCPIGCSRCKLPKPGARPPRTLAAMGTRSSFGSTLRYLREVTPADRPALDDELLDRFARHRDGAAFARLVENYGSLVLGVCRRVLRDP